jgi:hypothetical protein
LLVADRKTEIQHGLCGDLVGDESRLAKTETGAGVVLIGWADFDVRPGIRSSPASSPSVCADIVATAKD